ncbi:hypothetical protein CIRG_00012 [Coccidioides immitis RMSCC 2394]|uniref:Uncharacterized protein n=1 Tax=Coccidioides immitis RMSCC 2394 TaxID=404692 RepID=A0A0J6XWT9_COCIT|nr:hypothetical protein CIRG_00012 [Coccidioides immitis RMSCC 2394]
MESLARPQFGRIPEFSQAIMPILQQLSYPNVVVGLWCNGDSRISVRNEEEVLRGASKCGTRLAIDRGRIGKSDLSIELVQLHLQHAQELFYSSDRESQLMLCRARGSFGNTKYEPRLSETEINLLEMSTGGQPFLSQVSISSVVFKHHALEPVDPLVSKTRSQEDLHIQQ